MSLPQRLNIPPAHSQEPVLVSTGLRPHIDIQAYPLGHAHPLPTITPPNLTTPARPWVSSSPVAVSAFPSYLIAQVPPNIPIIQQQYQNTWGIITGPYEGLTYHHFGRAYEYTGASTHHNHAAMHYATSGSSTRPVLSEPGTSPQIPSSSLRAHTSVHQYDTWQSIPRTHGQWA